MLWLFRWAQEEAICPQRHRGEQSVCHVGVPSQWGQRLSSKFGRFVFLLQAENPPQQFCPSTFCVLPLLVTHFYHENAAN